MKKFSLIVFIALSFTLFSCVATVRPARQVVVVKTLPRIHQVVYVKGVKYYKWNGHYHKRTGRGYVVVSRF